jgi:ribosomal protein L9
MMMVIFALRGHARAQTIWRHVEPGATKPHNEVTRQQIIDKISKNFDVQLSPEQLELDAPITELGDRVLPVHLERGYSCSLVLTVEAR